MRTLENEQRVLREFRDSPEIDAFTLELRGLAQSPLPYYIASQLIETLPEVYVHVLSHGVLDQLAMDAFCEESGRKKSPYWWLLGLPSDVGKIYYPDLIRAPRKLTLNEQSRMDNHVFPGARLLYNHGFPMSGDCVINHHRVLNHRPYPSEDDIRQNLGQTINPDPPAALKIVHEIFAATDRIAALTDADRPYLHGRIYRPYEIFTMLASQRPDLAEIIKFAIDQLPRVPELVTQRDQQIRQVLAARSLSTSTLKVHVLV